MHKIINYSTSPKKHLQIKLQGLGAMKHILHIVCLNEMQKDQFSRLPNFWVIPLNTCGSSIHSVRSLKILDSASASTFSHPGK